MRQLFLFLFTVFALQYTQAAVEVKSYYFQGNTSELTKASINEITALQTEMTRQGFQFIEFNSFAQGNLNQSASVQLSMNRASVLLHLFSVEEEPITINLLGNRRVSVNFKPINWNRVDIYYFIPEEPEKKEAPVLLQSYKTANKAISTTQTHLTLATTERKTNKLPSPPQPKEVPAVDKTPMVLPILFIGGTWKVKEETMSYLYDLYNKLEASPNLSAHIRGHVCCGNNKRISKNRAKAVYKFLIENGISKDRISFKGYSNSIPLVYPERSGEDRSMNRRVDVLFTTK